MSIISLCGKQFVVSEGDQIAVFGAGQKVGTEVIGKDVLSGEDVKLKVVGEKRTPKIKVCKFIKKKGYHRVTGSRNSLTILEVQKTKDAPKKGTKTSTK